MLAVVTGGQTLWCLQKIKYEKEEFFTCPPIAAKHYELIVKEPWKYQSALKNFQINHESIMN